MNSCVLCSQWIASGEGVKVDGAWFHDDERKCADKYRTTYQVRSAKAELNTAIRETFSARPEEAK